MHEHVEKRRKCVILLRACMLTKVRSHNQYQLSSLHQSMLSIFDDEDAEKVLRSVLVELLIDEPGQYSRRSCWLAFAPQTRIPRTYKRFRGLVLQKITQGAENGSNDLIKVITSKIDLAAYLSQVSHDREEQRVNSVNEPSHETCDEKQMRSEGLPCSPLGVIRDRFIGISISSDSCIRNGCLQATLLSSTELKNLFLQLQVDSNQAKMLLFSIVITHNHSTKRNCVAPFLPIVLPLQSSEIQTKVPTLVAISRYGLKPQILCSRLLHSITGAARQAISD